MAFNEKPQLYTSHFNPNGSGTYKYNFWRSMNANGQEVKVYQHCRGLHTILVRQAPSLRVYLSTSQLDGVEDLETTHMITLKKEGDVVIFEKEFDNDGHDIILGTILPVAWCHLINNDHVTYAGKLEVIFEGLVIFEGYAKDKRGGRRGHLAVIFPAGNVDLSTVLVKTFFSRKKRKTSSGSGGAATPLAEATEVAKVAKPPAVAEGPHHTGTTEMATPPPEIMRELRKYNPPNPPPACIMKTVKDIRILNPYARDDVRPVPFEFGIDGWAVAGPGGILVLPTALEQAAWRASLPAAAAAAAAAAAPLP